MNGLIASLIEEEIVACDGVVPFCYIYPYLEGIRNFIYFSETVVDKFANYYFKITFNAQDGQITFRKFEYNANTKEWTQYQDVIKDYPCAIPMKRNGLFLADLPAELTSNQRPKLSEKAPTLWWLGEHEQQNHMSDLDQERAIADLLKQMHTTTSTGAAPWHTNIGGSTPCNPPIFKMPKQPAPYKWDPIWVSNPNHFWSNAKPLGYSYPDYSYSCRIDDSLKNTQNTGISTVATTTAASKVVPY